MFSVPSYVERKGSLYLKSDHMAYSRPILISDWHQAREAEPKDYDVSHSMGNRSMHLSTYRRLGNSSHEDWRTTTGSQLEQILLLKPRGSWGTQTRPLTVQHLPVTEQKRDTNRPKTGGGAVLPRYHPAYDTYLTRLKTIYQADYIPPYSHISSTRAGPPFPPILWGSHRKSPTQFTATGAVHPHSGQSTWQDEQDPGTNNIYNVKRRFSACG
ncbi:cilia- and flagella-associated protein 95 [Lampetra fluviatilis]